MAAYVYRPNHPNSDEFGMVSIDIAGPKNQTNSATYVISDIMDPMRHHGTGAIIDSKSKFRANTKASGCVELGNETIRQRKWIPLDRRQRREDIKRTIYNLRNGIKQGND